jgi:hypothetical protein
MENGDHKRAAEIFERLARGAESRGILKHASSLYLQAGRAHLLSGQEKRGKDFLTQGLDIIAKAQRWPALARVGKRVIHDLESHGFQNIADEFSSWLATTLPEPIESYKPGQFHKVQLPLKCPSCGGALRPDEVEYLDATTGECPFCGSAVRGD